MQKDQAANTEIMNGLEDYHQEVVQFREDARQHELHAQTVAAMSKYQVVYEKMESVIGQMSLTYTHRSRTQALSKAFNKLKEHSQITGMA